MNTEATQLTKQDWLDWIRNEADFRPLDIEGKPLENYVSVFHSGQAGKNFEKAEALSKSLAKDGYTVLEQTKDGKFLHQVELWQNWSKQGLTEKDVKEIWGAASEKFAHQASGKVYGFVQGAREDGIFRKTELKILLENEKVTHINEIPREQLLHHYQFSPDKKIALEEIHRHVSHGIKEIPDYSKHLQENSAQIVEKGKALKNLEKPLTKEVLSVEKTAFEKAKDLFRIEGKNLSSLVEKSNSLENLEKTAFERAKDLFRMEGKILSKEIIPKVLECIPNPYAKGLGYVMDYGLDAANIAIEVIHMVKDSSAEKSVKSDVNKHISQEKAVEKSSKEVNNKGKDYER